MTTLKQAGWQQIRLPEQWKVGIHFKGQKQPNATDRDRCPVQQTQTRPIIKWTFLTGEDSKYGINNP